MKSTTERRCCILEYLCSRGHETLDNLAFEFGVSKRTIRYDVEILSCSYPIYSIAGVYGGIYIAEGYSLGMKYLTDTECTILKRVAEIATDEDRIVIYKIIKTFSKPKIKGDKR